MRRVNGVIFAMLFLCKNSLYAASSGESDPLRSKSDGTRV